MEQLVCNAGDGLLDACGFADLMHKPEPQRFGGKLGVDATRKWKEEGFVRPWPGVIRMSEEVKERVDELWKKAGL